jgi:hypothetical protein
MLRKLELHLTNRVLKFLFWLHLTLIAGLPFLVSESSQSAKTAYWLLFGVFGFFAFIMWLAYRADKLKTGSAYNATIGFTLLYLLFIAVGLGLIICVDIEQFPKFRPILEVWVNMCRPFIPVLDRYNAAVTLSSTKYHASITDLDIFKIKATTALAIPYGLIVLAYLTAKEIWWPFVNLATNNNRRKMSGVAKLFAFPLAIFSFFGTIFGSIELNLKPGSRDICISNFYCYGDDNLLIVFAAYFKMVSIILFPIGCVIILSELVRGSPMQNDKF